MSKRTDQTIKTLVAIISLFGLLTYTFVHTGSLFARYVSPWWVGYLAAFGVEIAIAGMTLRLARKQTKNGFLMFALAAALTVSAFANISEGYAERYSKQLEWVGIWEIDPLQAIIGLSVTGLISLMVFAISEIIGVDVKAVTAQTERKQKAERKAEEGKQKPEQPKPTPNPVVDYKQPIWAILDEAERLGKPLPSQAELARTVDCSKATASKWVNAWENGKGELARTS